MYIVLISILVMLLIFIVYRLYPIWNYYLEINQGYQDSLSRGTYIPFYRVLNGFISIVVKLCSTPKDIWFILSGRFGEVNETMNDERTVELTKKLLSQANEYKDTVFIPIIYACFTRWKTEYGLENSETYLYLYSFLVNEIGIDEADNMDVGQLNFLRNEVKYKPIPDTDLYRECTVFFSALMESFDESRHGVRSLVTGIVFATFSNRQRLVKLLGTEVLKGYDKMTT